MNKLVVDTKIVNDIVYITIDIGSDYIECEVDNIRDIIKTFAEGEMDVINIWKKDYKVLLLLLSNNLVFLRRSDNLGRYILRKIYNKFPSSINGRTRMSKRTNLSNNGIMRLFPILKMRQNLIKEIWREYKGFTPLR